MSVSNRKRVKSLIQNVNKAVSVIKKRGRVSIARLAVELGYTSIDYFRRSVLPLIMELTECVRVENSQLVWVCGEGKQ